MVSTNLPQIVLVTGSLELEYRALAGLTNPNLPNAVCVLRNDKDVVTHFSDNAILSPSLILIDVASTIETLSETIRLIRKNRSTRLSPIVILGDPLNSQRLIDSYQLGANSWVDKRSGRKEFIDQISWIANYWLTINRCAVGL